MSATELARQLVEADAARRGALLARVPPGEGLALAEALRAQFDAARGGDPARALAAAAAVQDLARSSADPQVGALAAWTAGRAALQFEGRIEAAAECLTAAEEAFTALGQPERAAAVAVSTLHALAILGRYDEALACGARARAVFAAAGDTLALGKIEQNIGNIHARRERYREAEASFRAARERFEGVGDLRERVKADNNLGNVLTAQYRFRDAAAHFERAASDAEAAGLAVVRAEVECNLGVLALWQGQYDRALDYLERSRRSYAALGMTHEAAVAEQEIADAYLEVNLLPEAAALYERVIPVFTEREMRAEGARALANYGTTLLLLDRQGEAAAALAEARARYAAEGNVAGLALVTLNEAHSQFRQGDYAAAGRMAGEAEASFRAAGIVGRELLARWLRGEAARAAGHLGEAEALLGATLADAERRAVPQIAQRCLTSLGLVALAAGDRAAAQDHFERAVALIEGLRAPLPAEEFRTAFIADKLRPYAELVRLCLEDTADRATEALAYAERARARALIEVLRGAFPAEAASRPRDDFEAGIVARIEELRAELNWFYARINRPQDGDASRGAARLAALHEAAREREDAILDLSRQLRQRGAPVATAVEPVAVADLQGSLGRDTALVAYFSLDGELLAFLVTDRGVEVVRGLGSEGGVWGTVEQFRLQLGTLRHGAERLRPHLDQLTRRAQHHLGRLYDLLLRPIEPLLGERRLVVVPHRSLHYVPFHALFDRERAAGEGPGAGYVIARREVSYAPSASVLCHCLERGGAPPARALLLGVPDARAPRVRDEVRAIAGLFAGAVTALDGAATLATLRARAGEADLIHLACHGLFRPDNPLFSALQLADGWLTVRDAAALDLRCGLVTLSACETGMSKVAPGDELIGLAQGFFAAGTPALLVSLWTVDDASTARLMTEFYARLAAGDNAAAALRGAQRAVLEESPHPFYWSPFVLLGRW